MSTITMIIFAVGIGVLAGLGYLKFKQIKRKFNE